MSLAPQDTPCLILVGGLGTRLRAALPDLPKPMAPVRGRPFLEYVLASLKQAGFREIVFCVGYQAEKIEEHFGDGTRFGLRISYSREQELLGTGGAVKLAQPLISAENFLLLNGDCYNEIDFAALLQQHDSTPATATLVAAHLEDRSRFGSLKIDANHKVLGFEEKGAATGPGFINAGYYIFKRPVLDLIPGNEVCSLERDVFPRLVEQNAMYAFENHGDFIDIGLPEEWQRAASVLPQLS